MSVSSFLYLTTRGWKSGRSHEIEIWYVELDGRFYLISERGKRAHWVQNLARHTGVTFRVGGRAYRGTARILSSKDSKDSKDSGDYRTDDSLERRVRERFQTKHGWSTGLVVELSGTHRGADMVAE